MDNTPVPVTVLVVTRNESARVGRCLAALGDFSEVIVVDSGSADNTAEIARSMGARVEDFSWNGRYPKKRQWSLNNLSLRHDWVFFVDADEEVAPELVSEIRGLFAAGAPACAGYFIKGRYVMKGRALRFGLVNRKLTLFDRRFFGFPVVDDLGLEGMGEIEGHYQPVPCAATHRTGILRAALLHHAYDDPAGWRRRHENYARWERGMNARQSWPVDPVARRQRLKRVFRSMKGRAFAAFLHSYIACLGFLDGARGFALARDRYRYYRMIAS